MGYAFISFTSPNRDVADIVRNTLSENHIDTWMAPYNESPDGNYAAQITAAIRGCACFILILSEAAQNSDHVDSEVEMAIKQFKKTPVIIQLDQAPLNDSFTYYLQNKHRSFLPEVSADILRSKGILDLIRGYTTDREQARDVPSFSSREPKTDTTPYLEALWKSHHKGIIRDQRSNNFRELIDFFVLPDLLSDMGDQLIPPFFASNKYQYITAGSGLGKTTLLQISLLVNIINTLTSRDSAVVSPNSMSKLSEYQAIRAALFGEDAPLYFPVFIHANASNNSEWRSILHLADGCGTDRFMDMVEEAHKAGTLLFLIDSIDEVERGEKFNKFLSGVQRLLQTDYPNAKAIFTSRFLGKDPLSFDHATFHVAELSDCAIRRITESILSPQYTAKMLARFQENPHLMSLARNPFALLISLNTKDAPDLHRLLESIVTAVIERRWDKTNYDIPTDDIMLLLGHLACNFVFKGLEAVSFNELRRFFQTAVTELRRYGIEINIPRENMERFLRMLSCQSGILNIRHHNHVENYVFQDPLVMCWLAAHYISEILTAPDNEAVVYRQGSSSFWSNAVWINTFILGFTGNLCLLRENAVNTMLLVLVLQEDIDYQASTLYYLLFKYTTATTEEERTAIARGFRDILANTFGTNRIANNASAYRKMIHSALALHQDTVPSV